MTMISAAAAAPRAAAAPQDATRAGTSAAFDPRIEAALDQLAATESGRAIAQYLRDGSVPIRILDDAEFRRQYPGAGGVYDGKRHQISIPQSGLDSRSLVTMLAHEGHHAMDVGGGAHWFVKSLGMLGGGALDGARALVTGHNPITGTLDGINGRQNEHEVTAYRLQAEVAHELGWNEQWSLGQDGLGEPLAHDEIRENIAQQPLYRLDNPRRAILGGALGLLGTVTAGAGASALLAKVAPTSYLGRHAWPMYAAAGAVMGAFVLADQLEAARRRDG